MATAVVATSKPEPALRTQIFDSVKAVVMPAGRIVTDVDCVSKLSALARRIIEALGVFFGVASAGLKTLVGHLASFTMIAEFVEPIKRLFQLTKACDKGGSWANITALSCAVGARSLGVVNLLHKIGVIDVAGFASTVGSYAITPIAVIGLSFEGISNAMALHSNPVELAAAEAALELAKHKFSILSTSANMPAPLPNEAERKSGADAGRETQEDFNARRAKSKLKYEELRTKLEAANKSLATSLGNKDKKVLALAQLINVLWDKFVLVASPDSEKRAWDADVSKDTLVAKLKHDVTRWTKEVDNAKINKIKAVIGIIASFSKVIFMTLGFIGFVLSVSAIAFSTPLMITLGLVVAGIAVAKVVFDKYYDDSAMKVDDQPVEVAAAMKAAQDEDKRISKLNADAIKKETKAALGTNRAEIAPVRLFPEESILDLV